MQAQCSTLLKFSRGVVWIKVIVRLWTLIIVHSLLQFRLCNAWKEGFLINRNFSKSYVFPKFVSNFFTVVFTKWVKIFNFLILIAHFSSDLLSFLSFLSVTFIDHSWDEVFLLMSVQIYELLVGFLTALHYSFHSS